MRYVRRSLSSLAAVAGLLSAAAASAQLPTPRALASQMDLECRTAQGAPPVDELRIRQLNPVLQPILPDQTARLGALEDVCVPVAKNNNIPNQPARDIIRGLDLACYRAEAPLVDVPVLASHLNPELSHLPPESVRLRRLDQVCVPVAKNGVVPPPPVLAVVRHLDFACYELDAPTSNANTNVLLTHLNPVLVEKGLPSRVVQMERARRMCVPIGKGHQPIPPAVLNLVRWVDFFKYRVTPLGGPLAPLPLKLHHLNPLFAGTPAFDVTLLGAPHLLVPIAKNGVIPPGVD